MARFTSLNRGLVSGPNPYEPGTTTEGDVIDITAEPYNADPTGVADSTAGIQAALNAGQNVYKPAGTYIVTTLNFGMSGQVFYGPGVIQQKANTVAHCVNILTGLTDCLFTGGKIIGNNYLAGNFGLQIKGLRNGASQVTVTNTSNNGIIIGGLHTDSPQTAHCFVTDCRVYATGTVSQGISVNGDDAGGGPIHCSIANNHVSNTGEASIGYTGCSHLLIADNVCENSGFGTTQDGITGYDAFSSDILITGNTIYNTNNNGIHVGGTRLTITNNNVSTVANTGILVQQAPNGAPVASSVAAVTGNNVYNSAQVGISVGNYSNVTVSGNTVDTCVNSHGMQINDSGQGSGPRGFVITGNHVSNIQTGQGIRLEAVNDFTITGNTVNTTVQNGIKIICASGETIDTGVVSSNTIRNSGAAFSAISLTATNPGNINNVTVRGNTCDVASLPLCTSAGNVTNSNLQEGGLCGVNPTEAPFNAIGDMKSVSDGVTTAASPTLTSATAAFTTADVGKLVSVAGASQYQLTANTHSNTTIDNLTQTCGLYVGMSVSGSGLTNGTTIASVVSETAITISIASSTTLTGTTITFGNHLSTTISAYVSATQVTMAANATIAVTAAKVTWGTDNQAAFNAALLVCKATGATLTVPAGNFAVNVLPSGVVTPLLVFDGLNVQGTGRNQSQIRVFPDGSTQSLWYLLLVNVLTASCTFRDITLSGPDQYISSPTNPNPGNAIECIRHEGLNGLVKFVNCYVKQFAYGIVLQYAPSVSAGGSETSLDLDNCIVEGWQNNSNPVTLVGAFNNGTRTVEKYVHAHNCQFGYFGDPAGTAFLHALYVGCDWDLFIEDCRFYNAVGTGSCVNHHDNSTISLTTAGWGMRITGCVFEASVGQCSGTFGPYGGVAEITDNWFLGSGNTAISICGKHKIQGNLLICSTTSIGLPIVTNLDGPCVQVNDAGITATLATLTSATAGFTSSMVGWAVAIAGAGLNGATLYTTISAFTNSTTVTVKDAALNTVAAASLSVTLFGMAGDISFNSFDGEPVSASGEIHLSNTCCDTLIQGNEFRGAILAGGNYVNLANPGGTVNGMSARVINNIFRGSPANCINSDQGAGTLVVQDNHMLTNAGAAIRTSATIHNMLVVGNEFSINSGTIYNATFTQPTFMYTALNYGLNLVGPVNVASAATLTLPNTGTDAYTITGGTTITTMTIQPAGTQVTLIFGGAGGSKITAGGTFKISGNFTPGASGGTMTLLSDGTNWWETGRMYVA
jgi:Right handed beta helix region